MIQYNETRPAMEAMVPDLKDLRSALDPDGIKIKLEELEIKTTDIHSVDKPSLRAAGEMRGFALLKPDDIF